LKGCARSCQQLPAAGAAQRPAPLLIRLELDILANEALLLLLRLVSAKLRVELFGARR
jgi:hypothetical protein